MAMLDHPSTKIHNESESQGKGVLDKVSKNSLAIADFFAKKTQLANYPRAQRLKKSKSRLKFQSHLGISISLFETFNLDLQSSPHKHRGLVGGSLEPCSPA